MNQETVNYKGHAASIFWSDEDGCFVGEALDLVHTTFDICGATLEEARADFENFIDLYLDDCEKEGVEPERLVEAMAGSR